MADVGGRLRAVAFTPVDAMTSYMRRLRSGSELWQHSAPVLALAAILAWIFYLNPRTLSYSGMNLLLGSTVPLMFAAVSQMFIIAMGDIDLGIGSFVGLINAVAVTTLSRHPGLGILYLALLIAGYAGLAVVVHLRGLPSIVVTLAAGFIWLGLGLHLLPTPGGQAPAWLVNAFSYQVPVVPLPVVIAVGLAIVGYWIAFRTSYSAVLRGAGGNPGAVRRAGWSLLAARCSLYALAGLFGVFSGLAVTGITTSGDVNVAQDYTLLSIAAVILGGGEFLGGRISAVGAVLGAVTLGLVGPLLAFLHVSSDLQIGVQGFILLAVLAARVFDRRRSTA